MFAGGFAWYLSGLLVKQKGSVVRGRDPALLGVLFGSSGFLGVEAAAIEVPQDGDSATKSGLPETKPARRPVPLQLLEVRQKEGCDEGMEAPFCDDCGGGEKGKSGTGFICKGPVSV
jgi:hypothetical protein